MGEIAQFLGHRYIFFRQGIKKNFSYVCVVWGDMRGGGGPGTCGFVRSYWVIFYVEKVP